ncbi:MAG: DUF1801 domain-containing protein [Saprospiraceae bacterium]|jgi:hypothetical protein|nr:DUF1801 domain-containing protein [Saprospiraceae bacterium]
MNPEIKAYNELLNANDNIICTQLSELLNTHLPEAETKIWHRHPVWFLDGNPVAGYSKIKAGIRMFFWSGKSFDEPQLEHSKGKFQDASILYTEVIQIDTLDMARWIQKARDIQWDYKNIVKRKGELIRLK